MVRRYGRSANGKAQERNDLCRSSSQMSQMGGTFWAVERFCECDWSESLHKILQTDNITHQNYLWADRLSSNVKYFINRDCWNNTLSGADWHAKLCVGLDKKAGTGCRKFWLHPIPGRQKTKCAAAFYCIQSSGTPTDLWDVLASAHDLVPDAVHGLVSLGFHGELARDVFRAEDGL